MALRLAAISLCCSLRARSRSRARRILSAFALFLCCDFSSWQVTTSPVGRCVTRTAESVVLPLGVARVHAEELGGEEARLVAARARTDLEHRVALVVGVLGQEELLEGCVERGQARLERGQLAARQLAQLGVLLARELAVLLDLARHALALAPADDRLLELRPFPGELGELAPVGDDGRVRNQALQLLVASLDLGEAVEHRLTQRRRGGTSPTPRTRRAGRPRPPQAGVEPEPLRLRPYLRWKRSTRPAVSTSFCLPVKNGWHAEQISTWMVGTVERVSMTLPQAQMMDAFSYRG